MGDHHEVSTWDKVGSTKTEPENRPVGSRKPDGQALDKSAKKRKEQQNYADQILAGAWPGVGDHGGPAWAIRAHSRMSSGGEE